MPPLLQILCSDYSSPTSTARPPATPDFLAVSIVLPFPEGHLGGFMQYAVFSDCPLYIVISIYSSFMSFHGLAPRFFLVQSYVLLSGYITLYLFIHLLKDILVTSKFW